MTLLLPPLLNGSPNHPNTGAPAPQADPLLPWGWSPVWGRMKSCCRWAGMSWGRRCSPGVCSSSSACGVMAGAAPGVSSKLLPSPLPFLDQPILPLCGTGDSVPGGQCSHSQLPRSTPRRSTGKEVHFYRTGLSQAAKGQSSTYTDPHTHQQQLDQTTMALQNVLARKIHMKLGQGLVSVLIPAIPGTVSLTIVSFIFL